MKCELCDAPANLHNCQLPEKHSPGCERVRVPVQADRDSRGRVLHPAGWIDPEEHAEIHAAYERKWGRGHQSAERIAERGGFSVLEAEELLGRRLRTWRPR